MSIIESAVMPLKSEAIERAEQEANRVIARVISEMESANWDLSVAAPRPNSRLSRNEYARLMSRHDLFRSLTTYTGDGTRRPNEPEYRARSIEAEQRFITAAKQDAAVQYDLFVAKLAEKAGEATGAVLNGSHIWGYSILTVTKANGAVERWKTQMIINVSKLGKLFNQFPTRKIK